VAFSVAFEEGVLARRKMTDASIIKQTVGPAPRLLNEAREWQRIDSDFCAGKHLSISPEHAMARNRRSAQDQCRLALV
jgi:hypothetical protein